MKGVEMKRRSSIIFTLVLVLSLVVVMAGPMASPVQAYDRGPHDGASAENNYSIGTEAWVNPSNALHQDDTYTITALSESSNTSTYLKVTDFGFAMPSTATIVGIEVKVDRHATGGSLIVFDHSIHLVKDGSIVGTNRSEGAAWPGSDEDEYAVYGNETDVWGDFWGPDDINADDFGVVISAVLDGSGTRIAWVDNIQITVYYSIVKHTITMVPSPSSTYGSATVVTPHPTYEEDELVQVLAEPNTNYEFVEWTSVPDSGGTENSTLFDNPGEEEAIFTMPAYDVTVIAHFQVPPPLEIPTVTTKTAQGVRNVRATLYMDYTVGGYTEEEGGVMVQFRYRVVGATYWDHTPQYAKYASGNYSRMVPDLTPETDYEFEACLEYDHTPIYGGKLYFTTDESGTCFIATAAYGTPAAEQIDVLREFRDNVLLESIPGSLFVSLYYQFSPPVADFIAENEPLRILVRELLIDPIVCVVDATGNIWRH
jgi:hypothetical protein